MRHGRKKWRDMPPSAHARTVDTSLSFRGHSYCKLKRAQMVNLGAGMNPARGERFEGVTYIMIGIDFKLTANKEKM